jgi:hypothetical protein
MARTPQRTAHSNLIVTSGDLITGDDVAPGGVGGVLTLEGGTASLPDSAAGSMVLRPGLPTGSGARAVVNVTNNGGADFDAILQLTSQGANAEDIRMFVGTRDPNGLVVGNPGDLYVRHNGATSTIKINTGAGDSNTTWTDLLAGQGFLDTRSTPLLTGSATSAGGTVNFTIATGFPRPMIEFLDVEATSNTVSSDVRFYRDAARTSLVYEALARDAFTAPFVDATPWVGYNRAGDLESNTLYGRITNNGANASTYSIRVRMRE